MRTTFRRQLAYLATLIGVSSLPLSVAAQPETVIHIFQGAPNDGLLPAGGVVFDAQGNLYGATAHGGNGGENCIGLTCGTVYQLVPPARTGGAWTGNILYNFTGVTNHQDGELPSGGLVIDTQGNLYGVTAYGGTGGCLLFGGVNGCGTVYEVSPPSIPGETWTRATLYSFQGGSDGQFPIGNLTFDQAGNLYGSTYYGGGYGSCNAPFYQNCGTVFELSPPTEKGGAWTEKVLYSFKGFAADITDGNGDGANPNGGLILDSVGNIYGTTYIGGFLGLYCDIALGKGCGTVFELQPTSVPGAWTETVLYRFHNSPDGALPLGGLVVDSPGTLYGTTEGGGIDAGGTIFRISGPPKPREAWNESVVSNLGSALAGDTPMAGLSLKNSVLYGTNSGGGGDLAGTVFRFDPSPANRTPSYGILTDFWPGNQAAQPESTVTFDKHGNLYGTTQVYDGVSSGAVYMISRF